MGDTYETGPLVGISVRLPRKLTCPGSRLLSTPRLQPHNEGTSSFERPKYSARSDGYAPDTATKIA